MGPPQTVSIETDHGLSIVADHWPGIRTPVVLAHGGGQTRHSWKSAARALAAEGHRVLAMDLRGHGDSDWHPDGDYGIEWFAADALEVVDWVGRPVVWIGASLGGLTGLIASARQPQAIASLVLVDITPRPSTEGVERILDFMGQDVEHGFGSLEEAADAVAAYQPHRPRPADLSGLAKNLRRGEDGRWRWHWDPRFLGSRPPSSRLAKNPAEEAARQLAVPTLLVRGRLSDLVTENEAQEFLRLVPHAEYVDVADAAHMVAGDKNDIFTAVVTRFVANGRLANPEAS